MAETKYILRYIIEGLLFVVAGVNLVDVLSTDMLTTGYSTAGKIIEEAIKLGMAILGFIYFFLRIRQYQKEMKYKNEDRKLDLKKKQLEVDNFVYQSYLEKAKQKKQHEA